jgi:type IV pilus assembly protein PilO
MVTKAPAVNFDLTSMFVQAADQFRGLNANEPGQWPVLPKLAAFGAVIVAAVVVGWFLLLSSSADQLDAERNKEPTLKQDYRAKLAQAINLAELRKQKSQVEEYVTQLEKQLPGKAEMDALLSDINQAGLGRGLQFELFRPGQVVVKDYYAELPIAIKVSGRYHDIGAFAADVANLSRIVTLNDVTIQPPGTQKGLDTSGVLAMEATARTYRYLDAGEVEEQKKEREKEKAKKTGAKK